MEFAKFSANTRTGVKCIEMLFQSVSGGSCLASIQQDWENVGPVELRLRVFTYVRRPDMLLKEEEAIACDSDVSQCLSLTSSIMGYQRAEVHKVVTKSTFSAATWTVDLVRHFPQPAEFSSLFTLSAVLEVQLYPAVPAVLPPTFAAFLTLTPRGLCSTVRFKI